MPLSLVFGRRSAFAALASAGLVLAVPGCATTRGPQGSGLALNPADPPRLRPMLVDIEDYDIHVDLDLVAAHVAGHETVRFRALPDAAATRLELDAVDLQILGARDETGRELPWNEEGGLLTVELHDPVAPGEESRVSLDWSCWPRRGLYVVGPSASNPGRPWHCWTQGETHEARYWLPVRDWPDDRATHTLAITLDDRFLTMAAGERIASRRDEATGRRTDTWSMQVPHSSYLITLVAGDLAQAELPDSSRPLPVVTDAASLPAAQAELAATSEMLALLENFAGRAFPYPKYAQCLVHDFVAGGQENISATTLTHETLHAAQDDPQAEASTEDLIVHEAMHQWFGDLVTCRDWGHLWLNEGFATYAEMLWHRHRGGDEDARALLLHWQREMVATQRSHPDPVVQPRWDDPDDLFDTSRYDGAAGRLWLLAQELGEDTFTAGVRRYLHENEAKSVTTDALRSAMEAASHRDLSGWFAEWITGTGYPSFEVRVADSGEPRLLVRQAQASDGGHVFHLPVQVQWSRGGAEHAARLAVQDAHAELALQGEGPLDWVRFDAACAVPGEVDLLQPEDAWRRQLLSAHDGVTRLLAAQWFALNPAVVHGNVGSPELARESLEALARAASTDSFLPVRTTALAALAARAPDGDEAAAAALLSLAGDPQPELRATAAEGLSERGDEAGTAVLLHLVQDPNGDVAGAALASLVQRHDPQAFAIGRRLATDPDPLRGPLRADALTALAQLADEPGVAPLLVAAARADVDSNVRIAALRALRGRSDPPAAVKLSLLGEALWDQSYTVRAAAARELSRWPAELAAPLLSARAELEPDPTVLRALRAPRHAAPADD